MVNIKPKIKFLKIIGKNYWPLIFWILPMWQLLSSLDNFSDHGYGEGWIYALIGNSADKGNLTWLIVPFVSIFWILPIFLIPYIRKNYRQQEATPMPGE